MGGGELAHVSPEGQRRWKSEVLLDQLGRIGRDRVMQQVDAIGGVEVRPAPGDEESGSLLGRRTRIECVVDAEGFLGMRQYRSHKIVRLGSMPLASAQINELPVWEGNEVFSSLPQGSRVRLIAPPGGTPVICTDQGCWDGEGNSWDGPLHWRISHPQGMDEYAVRPWGFWQTHRSGAEVLARNVEEIVSAHSPSRVMELYSGAGLFSLPLSRVVGDQGALVTLEADEAAVADAANNLGRSVCEPFVGDVDGGAVRELNDYIGGVEVIVADPPRAGAGQEVCHAMANTGAQCIVLVSCDPAAASRDLHDLCERGYRIADMRAWDLFPYTHHFEVMTALTKD